MKAALKVGFYSYLCVACACASSPPGSPNISPLRGYLRNYKYEAFNPPRDRDGVGTIIDFKDNFESVVVSPDPPNGACLTDDLVPRGPDINVATLDQEYSLSRNSDLEFSLPKAIVKEIDLKAAFNDGRIKKVAIKLKGAFERRITKHDVQKYLATLKETDLCYKHLADPRNYLINRVLGAKGLAYTFLDEKNQKINLDASILEKIGFKAGNQSQFNGKDSIQFDEDILVGYRIWRVTETQGLAGKGLDVIDIEVTDAKARSRG
jgi:hypothetical protein